MKAVIIFNHPYSGSYCNAILESVKRGLQRSGHIIDVMHLDEEGFNPVMTAEDRGRIPRMVKAFERVKREPQMDQLEYGQVCLGQTASELADGYRKKVCQVAWYRFCDC